MELLMLEALRPMDARACQPSSYPAIGSAKSTSPTGALVPWESRVESPWPQIMLHLIYLLYKVAARGLVSRTQAPPLREP